MDKLVIYVIPSMKVSSYFDNDVYETPRSKIPIPLGTSQTQPTSICHTPKQLQFIPTPLSTKSEPKKSNTLSFDDTVSNSELEFALDLVKLIIKVRI